MSQNFFSRWRRSLCAVFLCLACAGAASWRQVEIQAQTDSQPPTEPILRIETGMHTASIIRIAVDPAGRYLVTGSEDKTVRVWDLLTGRLQRTLRAPIGPNLEGIIYAVAISPDGRLIAAGGWTGRQWENNKYSVYIFDRQSGQMKTRLNGLASTIYTLAFSRDGKRLAISTFGNGIRGFNVADGTEILIRGEEKYESPEINGIDFDRAGRLVTTCTDGYLRLYDREMSLLKKVRAPGGKRLYAVRFAPDGAKVAVGYEDGARMDVLDGGSLEALYQPNTSGMSNGDLRAVAWSADGTTLYAGGGWRDETGVYLVRRWAGAGRGRYQDMTAASGAIMDLAPLPDGGAVFGSDQPSWGAFSAKGRRVRFVAGESVDYRESKEGILSEGLGDNVAFAYDSSGKSLALLDMVGPRLRLISSWDPNLLRPARVDGSAVTDWRDSKEPKFRGAPLRLKFGGEISRSLVVFHDYSVEDVFADRNSFLLGTNLSLYRFNSNGKLQWRTEVPSPVRSVNAPSSYIPSGPPDQTVAALGDGTIRWYRFTDGKELLAFFVHKSTNRWVVWTPEGYYYCSFGAENLIGWHVNNGKDQAAEFFPAARFRGLYYRPGAGMKTLNPEMRR